VLGNYGASTEVLLGLWVAERHRLGIPSRQQGLLAMLVRFGGPTVPAEAAVYALNAVDRAYLLRVKSPGAAGVYALAAKLSMVVIIAVRGFQAAWPPLVYSVRDDDEARRLYAFVTTAYVLATGTVVAGLFLLGRWFVRLLAPPEFFAAHEALPWVALGWALYGLFLVFVTIAGRAKVMTRNFPAAAAGLAVNVVVLLALVGPLGIAGAGIALCAAYLAMLVAIHLGTRRLFAVPFEWGRLALLVGVLAGVAGAGELTLPTSGVAGFVTRSAALLLIPGLLVAARFFRTEEIARVRALVRRRS
jgi:O-antigen/teichoic acid export membrane protein